MWRLAKLVYLSDGFEAHSLSSSRTPPHHCNVATSPNTKLYSFLHRQSGLVAHTPFHNHYIHFHLCISELHHQINPNHTHLINRQSPYPPPSPPWPEIPSRCYSLPPWGQVPSTPPRQSTTVADSPSLS